jgi:acyl-coenzyme A synthetase/AMP-(fatty) acid ligase
VLRALPEIAEAAAVPVPDATRGEEVKVFVVLQAGHSRDDVTPARIVTHCEASLARFKVPRYVAYVDRLRRRRPTRLPNRCSRARPTRPPRRTTAWKRVGSREGSTLAEQEEDQR